MDVPASRRSFIHACLVPALQLPLTHAQRTVVRFRAAKKQLLWDASVKLRTAKDGPVVFWGTGEETRDWISSEDAAELVVTVSRSTHRFTVVNGASGQRVTVRQTLTLLKSALGVDVDFVFNGEVREGDPRFYHADVSQATALGWRPSITLVDGLGNYVKWLNVHQEHPDD